MHPRLSILARLLMAVMMVCWLPACLCGGDRTLQVVGAGGGSHSCCQKQGDKGTHPGKPRRCDCDQSPAVVGKMQAFEAQTLDVALPPLIDAWRAPVALAITLEPLKALRQVRGHPVSSLLRQHCALIV